MPEETQNLENAKFIGVSKSAGGSVYAVFRLSKEDFRKGVFGETVDGGLACFKAIDETKRTFKIRCSKELGLPQDHEIWGESDKE